MNTDAWDRFKSIAVSGRAGGKRPHPVALIIDSPWIPGFKEISHLDYFLLPDLWMKANLSIEERFPDVVFLPGFWVEYGMATEPSAFGCKVVWGKDGPPSLSPAIRDISEVSRLQVPDPSTDGLMPLALNLYRRAEESLGARGDRIRMVAARGPLTLAGHIRGVTEFLMDLKLNPSEAKSLLEITTQTVIEWLKAQMRALPGVEGIMVLDDLVGFLSPADYGEFAHPLLKRIFGAFPDAVKVYHNDNRTDHILEGLADTGFHLFNFSHNHDIGEVFRRVGDKVRLLGNVPPLEVMSQGTPDEVRSCVKSCIEKTDGGKNLILSAGGGVSPGTPAKNIDALIQAAKGA
jgi:MtaA/CmuA family methyltransferase